MSSEQIKQALYNSDQMKTFTEEKGNWKGNKMVLVKIISKALQKNPLFLPQGQHTVPRLAAFSSPGRLLKFQSFLFYWIRILGDRAQEFIVLETL